MQYFTEIALQKSDFPFDTAITASETVQPHQEEYVHNHDCLELFQVLHEGGYLLYNGSKKQNSARKSWNRQSFLPADVVKFL